MSVFIHYSKAFHTIQHETLINKLTNLNFSNSSIKIILSYLSTRQQYVQLDDKKILISANILWGSTGQHPWPCFI